MLGWLLVSFNSCDGPCVRANAATACKRRQKCFVTCSSKGEGQNKATEEGTPKLEAITTWPQHQPVSLSFFRLFALFLTSSFELRLRCPGGSRQRALALTQFAIAGGIDTRASV
ncbi:unnamed protein product [Ceratitis capitata]|uniref:(Mediterranean fruit fly) hypothetical protein n=1 Tax=Ceratitis capitata TaxID=7213 RepID=A0A811UX23_CERCA|nr:unnamed protein product [Ceratitis capitata]